MNRVLKVVPVFYTLHPLHVSHWQVCVQMVCAHAAMMVLHKMLIVATCFLIIASLTDLGFYYCT